MQKEFFLVQIWEILTEVKDYQKVLTRITELTIDEWEEGTRRTWPNNLRDQPEIDVYLRGDDTIIVEVLDHGI